MGERSRCPHCGSRLITWSPAQLISAAKAWAVEHGRSPRPRDWQDAAVDHPSQRTVYERFDTWDAFLDAAGLERHRTYRRWTREEITQAVYKWRFVYGRLPRATEWNRATLEYPSRAVVVNRFGSWGAGMIAAGYKPVRLHRSVEGYQRQAGATGRGRDVAGRFSA